MPWHALQERLDRVETDRRRGRVVGVADHHEPRCNRNLARHRLQVVPVLGIERHLDRPRAGGRGQMRVDAERRPRVDDLRARLEQRLSRREQDVAGAVAKRDPVRPDPVAVGKRPAQRRVGGVGIPVRARDHALGCLDDLGQRREARLVGREHRDVGAQVVAGGDGIDRDPADALREFDRHRPIVPTRDRPAAPAPRPGRRDAARDPRRRSSGPAPAPREAASPGPESLWHRAAAPG